MKSFWGGGGRCMINTIEPQYAIPFHPWAGKLFNKDTGAHIRIDPTKGELEKRTAAREGPSYE